MVAVVVVAVVAVIVDAADVDAVSFRGQVPVVDSGKIAPVVADVARHHRTWYL